ncbi:MAG TPA: HAMP domain-containing histidine kinase [Candidatus Marinimicrobia bacterium]|nr:HAMP domain-containing histidine kinase [Candidatus Neomarinimicrobiota bacterium]
MVMNGKAHKPAKLILPFHTLDTLRIRIGWIINLRWVALFGLLVAIPISQRILDFQIAYSQLYTIAGILIGLNLVYFFLFRYYPFRNFRQELAFTEIQIIIDLIIISFAVHYIGGIGNPFFFIYIVIIIISGVLFLGNVPYINAIVAAVLLTTWSILEYKGIVPNYTIRAEPVRLPVLVTSLCAFYILIFAATYVIKDFISGYRQLKKLIDEKSIQLENTIRERDKIFRFTAHELKSPLTTLRSMLAVIEEIYAEKMDPEIASMIKRAVIRTDQVLDMVKDMIDVTQYRHGVTENVIETIYFNNWVEKIVNQLRDYAERKKISIQVGKISPELTIQFDSRALEKVLTNLINNAIRYSPENATVRITPFYKRSLFGFSVSDTGIGIAKEDLPKIFDEFFRSKNAREMERLGTGLGLSLIKQIVEFYGGRIYVESELGQGSTFTVEIPLKSN